MTTAKKHKYAAANAEGEAYVMQRLILARRDGPVVLSWFDHRQG
jgi:hypothetical protein